jgi:hypothetical protein
MLTRLIEKLKTGKFKEWIVPILVLLGGAKIAQAYAGGHSTEGLLIGAIMVIIWLIRYSYNLSLRIKYLEDISEMFRKHQLYG